MGHPMDAEIDAELRKEAERRQEQHEREQQELRRKLAKVLEDHESLSMDDSDDRAVLLAALMEAL